MGFKTEKELFDAALTSNPIQHLTNLYTNTTCLVEPTGLFGIPDLVIASYDFSTDSRRPIMAVAFEMKLSNWKRALAQAFRYRAFAEVSFVVLDSKYINRALKQIEKFQTANIGLLSIDLDGNLNIHHQPSHDIPFCEQTRSNFEKKIFDITSSDGESISHASQVDRPSQPPENPYACAMA